MTIRSLAIGVLLVVSPVFAQGPSLDSLVGKKIPAFKMTTTEGKTLTSQSLLKKVVLLDFWGTWCAPCRAMSPSMEKLHKGYSKRGLVVIGVGGFERKDPENAAKNYKKEHGYTYTFTKNNDAYARKLGAVPFPKYILIDRQGIVRKVYGKLEPKDIGIIENDIKNLL